MKYRIHPHASERMAERGVSENEILGTLEHGERFPAKFDRSGFRRNIPFDSDWHGRRYGIKQVEVYAVEEASEWIVLTVITRYF